MIHVTPFGFLGIKESSIPTIESYTTGTAGAAATSITGTMPSGAQAGDLIVAFATKDGDGLGGGVSPNTPGDWDYTVYRSNDNTSICIGVADYDAGLDLQFNCSGNDMVITVLRISGAAIASSQPDVADVQGGGIGTTMTSSGQTTVTDNTLTLVVFNYDGGDGTFGSPTNGYSTVSEPKAGASTGVSHLVCQKLIESAGASGGCSCTVSLSDDWSAVSIAIKP